MTEQDSLRETKRIAMDMLLIARSFKGEGRRDMQELLPVHADLMQLIEDHTAQALELKEAELKFMKERYELEKNKVKLLQASIAQAVKEARINELNRIPFRSENNEHHKKRMAELTQEGNKRD